ENKNNKKISYNPFPGINQASAGQISAFKANSGEEVRVQTEGSRNESSDSVCALERKFPANKEAINRLAQKEINLDKYEKKVGNALEDKDRTTKRVLGVYDIFSRAPRGIYLASNRDSVTNNRGFIISYSSNGLGQVNEMIERVTMVCGTEAPNSLFEFFVVNSDPNSSDNEPYTIRQGDDEKKIEQNYSSKVLT
ncbi:hypothetical protein, partial [Caballeronia calidae]|uniref:hypothetical protein n=1 Tax=Caballeronia calidae TaxID=1777139 RepID=UPI000A4EA96A